MCSFHYKTKNVNNIQSNSPLYLSKSLLRVTPTETPKPHSPLTDSENLIRVLRQPLYLSFPVCFVKMFFSVECRKERSCTETENTLSSGK